MFDLLKRIFTKKQEDKPAEIEYASNGQQEPEVSESGELEETSEDAPIMETVPNQVPSQEEAINENTEAKADQVQTLAETLPESIPEDGYEIKQAYFEDYIIDEVPSGFDDEKDRWYRIPQYMKLKEAGGSSVEIVMWILYHLTSIFYNQLHWAAPYKDNALDMLKSIKHYTVKSDFKPSEVDRKYIIDLLEEAFTCVYYYHYKPRLNVDFNSIFLDVDRSYVIPSYFKILKVLGENYEKWEWDEYSDLSLGVRKYVAEMIAVYYAIKMELKQISSFDISMVTEDLVMELYNYHDDNQTLYSHTFGVTSKRNSPYNMFYAWTGLPPRMQEETIEYCRPVIEEMLAIKNFTGLTFSERYNFGWCNGSLMYGDVFLRKYGYCLYTPFPCTGKAADRIVEIGDISMIRNDMYIPNEDYDEKAQILYDLKSGPISNLKRTRIEDYIKEYDYNLPAVFEVRTYDIWIASKGGAATEAKFNLKESELFISWSLAQGYALDKQNAVNERTYIVASDYIFFDSYTPIKDQKRKPVNLYKGLKKENAAIFPLGRL